MIRNNTNKIHSLIKHLHSIICNVEDRLRIKTMTYEFWVPKCFWTSGKALHETPPRHVSKRMGVGGIYKKLRNRDE
jgi:hypothetical protein